MNRLLADNFKEGYSPEEILELEAKLMVILGDTDMNARECEKKILSNVGYDKSEVVKVLVRNRFGIYFCSKFH